MNLLLDKVRMMCVIISGALAGLGGCFFSLGQFNMFVDNMVSGRGFIAVAAVIFGKWNPKGILGASLIFGAADALQIRLQMMEVGIPYQFLLMFPYLLTVIAVTGIVGKTTSPKALGNPKEGQEPNVGGIGVREWEGGYVAGALAAMYTETKQMGAIGSFPFPVIAGTLDAFEAAAQEYDPSIKVTKTYVNSWEDIQKGKETALAMAESGADIIFCSANQVGLGSIEAAKSKGVKAIGYISPQNEIAPDTVISSVTYNTPGLFKATVEQLINGELKAEGKSLGWADGVLDMEWGEQATQEVKDYVEKVIQDLKDGKVENPYKGE